MTDEQRAKINARLNYRYANDPEYRERKRAQGKASYRKRADKVRAGDRKRTYGITAEQHAALLEQQYHACAICMTQDPGKGKTAFDTDHDHVTNKVRGLLCSRCNLMLGLSKDNATVLRLAALYLDQHSE